MALVIACGGEKDDDQFREDTLTCEEALAHLQDCCPGFDAAAVACRYYYVSQQGCAAPSEDREQPAFDLAESRCIRNTSCADVRADAAGGSVCARSQKAVQYIDRTEGSFGSAGTATHQGHAPVCP